MALVFNGKRITVRTKQLLGWDWDLKCQIEPHYTTVRRFVKSIPCLFTADAKSWTTAMSGDVLG